MRNITKKALSYFSVGTSFLVLEHVPIINYLIVIFVFFAVIYYYIHDNLDSSLFFILLFSAITQEGVNLYTLNLSGLSSFYFCVFILLFISFFSKKNFFRTIHKVVFYYLILVSICIIFLIKNVTGSELFIVKDFLIIVFIPFCFYFLFKSIPTREVLVVIYCTIGVKFFASLIFFLTGITLRVEENLHGAAVVDNGDELGALYIILITSIFLFLKRENKVWLNITFGLAAFGTFFYGLGFLGLGSQVVLMLLLVLLVYICKRKLIFLLLVPCVFLLYPLIDVSNNELLVYKLDNIIGLISNLNKDSIYLIPHSPQVRVIELINIFNYSWYNVLFGHGLGGYFTDQYFAFNQYIGKFDFSDYEISTRRFYNPHNIAFGLLKMGIVWWFFIAYLFYTALKVKDNETKIFLLVASFVLFLNFGYAIKTSILLALVFIVIRNHQRASICEKEN